MNERVLLLNMNYFPLAQITIPRAVNLILGERVRPAEGGGIAKRLKTPSTIFEVPSVLVLTRYVHVPSIEKKWSKQGVLERDQYTCIYCGRRPGHTSKDGSTTLKVQDFTIDHIVPKYKNGGNTWGNTACSCYDCNHTKGNRSAHEAGMKLRWNPKTPRTDRWVASGEVPVSWKAFLEY